MPTSPDQFIFSDQFAQLGHKFSVPQTPTPLPDPYLVAVSPTALQLCGLAQETVSDDLFLQVFSGNQVAPDSTPRATVYSGHQFGVWAGQLGDGRAILLGELDGQEIQLKGAGATPYSRMGDGRAVLRSSIREFLCSEAMAGLGIPTTRALCITGSDFRIMREQPESTAVVTRLAPSFIRFGSFEHWYYREDHQALQTLADHVIARYYPELAETAQPYLALLTEVCQRTARLMAQWQMVGFMHGVMNTDNMSILGLTLDYGPFGFMEAFDPQHICNHSDTQGRYAYAMQPQIGHWNCLALGQALLPLTGAVEDTMAALATYQEAYAAQLSWHDKLGLRQVHEEDKQLISDMFAMMNINGLDFSYFFRQLSYLSQEASSRDERLRDLCVQRELFDHWLQRYRLRLKQEASQDGPRQNAMQAVNPKYILRNYLAQQAIEKAQNKDFSEVDKLRQILAHPFDEQPEHDHYAALPPDWGKHLSVSCSS